MAQKPKVLIARALPAEALQALRQHFELVENPTDKAYTADEFAAAASGCVGLLVAPGNSVDAAFLDRCPGLKVVSNVAVGYDHIDVAACTARKVLVTNTPGVLDGATADLTWALMLAACRRVAEADAYVRAGEWGRTANPFLGVEVNGATLGIVGLGRIGQAVARRARGFDMKVVYFQAERARQEVEGACNASFVGLPELLSGSDIVSLHIPYSASTHHFIGAQALAQMKPSAVLVNAARGGVVDDAALIAALQSGKLAAAGLDVFEGEPKLNPAFATLKNVVLTPHIGSATMATRVKMMRTAITNLVSALATQRAPHPVNPEAWQ
jgi:gluconate 2-dehydrogenase